MSLAWQILMPPFDFDLGDAGKLASDGWLFLSAYNTERATGKLRKPKCPLHRELELALQMLLDGHQAPS